MNSRRCDPRCTSATGPDCSCSCGGANHGAGNQSEDGLLGPMVKQAKARIGPFTIREQETNPEQLTFI